MKVTIIKADASNKEWNWMAVCEQHLQVITADTRKELTNYTLADFWSYEMRNWNWTPRARFIGELLTAVAVVAAGWVLFVGTWFALGGN
jgi:hypothetical protein